MDEVAFIRIYDQYASKIFAYCYFKVSSREEAEDQRRRYRELFEPAPDEALDESWVEPSVFAGCSAKGQAKPGQAQPIHVVRSVPATGSGANVLSGAAR